MSMSTTKDKEYRYFTWRSAITRKVWVLDQHWYGLIGWLYLCDLTTLCTCCHCPRTHRACVRHDIRMDSWTHIDEARLFPAGRTNGGPCSAYGWQEPTWWEWKRGDGMVLTAHGRAERLRPENCLRVERREGK